MEKKASGFDVNMDDSNVVAITRDLTFFSSEPGAGVIGLGIAMEPTKAKEMVAWGLSLGSGVFLSSQHGEMFKLLSIGLVLASLKPFGETKYIRFAVGMATVMRVLRVFEVLLEPRFFEKRGAMYTIKFAFLYHDLRRAQCFDTKDEQSGAVQRAIKDIGQCSLGLFAVIVALHGTQQRFTSIKAVYMCTMLSMLRFYFFINAVEAGYRLHLAHFGIQAPKCFDSPWESETVQEFWGKRWNLSIAQQLRAIFFKPLALQGRRTMGELLVFLASAALHILPIASLGGSSRAVQSTAFYFVLQPVLIALERTFPQVLRGKAWVQLSMWTLAPLFALPMLKVM